MPRAPLQFNAGEFSVTSGQDNLLCNNMYPQLQPEGSRYPYTLRGRPSTVVVTHSGSSAYTPANYDQVQYLLEHKGVVYFLALKLSTGKLDLYSTTSGSSTNITCTALSTGAIPGRLVEGYDIPSGTRDEPPKIVASNHELMIRAYDGTCWLYDISGASLAQVTDADFPTDVSDVTYQDGYFIVTETATQKFYISDLQDGSSWQALEFASATSNPDDLVGCTSFNNELWLFGGKSTEVWYNSGNAAFPFEKRPGVSLPVGLAYRATVVHAGSSLMWVGKTNAGGLGVYRTEGYAPQIVSTKDVDLDLRNMSGNDSAFYLHFNGDVFYILQGPSWAYHLNSNTWFRWYSGNTASFGSSDVNLRNIAILEGSSNVLYTGNTQNGELQYLAETGQDNGTNIYFSTQGSHFYNLGQLITINQLELYLGSGSAPSNNFTITVSGGYKTHRGNTSITTRNPSITFTDSTSIKQVLRMPSFGQGYDWQFSFQSSGYPVNIVGASVLFDVDGE